MASKDPTPDESQRMVQDALASLPKSWNPLEPGEAERLIQRAMDVSKAVDVVTRELDRAVRAKGTQHDKTTLVKIVSKEYFNGFGDWSKDELLYLLVFMHTDLVIDKILGATDTKKIFTL